jgi:hypothetical protein
MELVSIGCLVCLLVLSACADWIDDEGGSGGPFGDGFATTQECIDEGYQPTSGPSGPLTTCPNGEPPVAVITDSPGPEGASCCTKWK